MLNIHLKIPYSVDKMKTMPQIPRKPEEPEMRAIITRPMIVATDAGTAKQFVPVKDQRTGEDVPQTMSEAEFGRLRRAGAAQRFIEVNHAEVETESATGSVIPAIDDDAIQGARDHDTGSQPDTSEQGEAEAAADPALRDVAPGLPLKRDRKTKA